MFIYINKINDWCYFIDFINYCLIGPIKKTQGHLDISKNIRKLKQICIYPMNPLKYNVIYLKCFSIKFINFLIAFEIYKIRYMKY